MNESRLADELRALGRELASLETPPADRVATAVMERLAGEPLPVGPSRWTRLSGWLRQRARTVLAALLVLLAGLALAPPVRAAVADFFDFGGVRVRPGPAISSAPPPPSVPARMTLAEAERLVGFKPAVPRRLGQPDGIEVSADHRIVSMTWRNGPDGPVRIDQFDGRLASGFIKMVHESAQHTLVSYEVALWFPRPHQLVLLDEKGDERIEAARPAGPTLVWQTSGTTLRLEGIRFLKTAVEVAETA